MIISVLTPSLEIAERIASSIKSAALKAGIITETNSGCVIFCVLKLPG
jgi:hypothetical protein